MEGNVEGEVYNCEFRLREDPRRRKDKIHVGCGAGFGGDRPLAALKLLQRVPELDYLVFECLAERTLADRYQLMISGEKGYDNRISEWMSLLLPLAVERGVCIITNMGAMDPVGAQEEVMDLASRLGLRITVSVAHESSLDKSGLQFPYGGDPKSEGGTSTYLGAAPIVWCLEQHDPHVVITSRIADAALFLAPMVYELGWNWNDFSLLAQGTLAGHLLECGCQLTGGYFMHPGDKYREFSFEQLLDASLPYAEVGYNGDIYVAKAEGSRGLLNHSTCAEQLLYEVGDPAFYITPDVVIDLQNVNFNQLTNDRVQCLGVKPSNVSLPDKLLQLVPTDCGWKGWGEISYGGYQCLKRAEAADFLVRSGMDEVCPGVNDCILSYTIGHDSLKTSGINEDSSVKELTDIRLHMDGLFNLKEHAICFTKEFTGLYTNGPAGGGGIITGMKKEVVLQKKLVERKDVFWQTNTRKVNPTDNCSKTSELSEKEFLAISRVDYARRIPNLDFVTAAPSGKRVRLYEVAHSRARDKGNDLNFSIIPYFKLLIESSS